MNEPVSAAEMLEQIHRIGKLSMAAIEETAARNARRWRRRPVDPAELLTSEVLVALRRMNHELEATIERIEDAQRQWAKNGRAVVISGGIEAHGGQEPF